jgi:hypothetical protein
MSPPDEAGAAGCGGHWEASRCGGIGLELCPGIIGVLAPKIAVKLSAPLCGGAAGGFAGALFFGATGGPLEGDCMMSVGESNSSAFGALLGGAEVPGAEIAPKSCVNSPGEFCGTGFFGIARSLANERGASGADSNLLKM